MVSFLLQCYCSTAETSPCLGSTTCMRRTVRTGLFRMVHLILKHIHPRDIDWCLEKPNNFFCCSFLTFVKTNSTVITPTNGRSLLKTFSTPLTRLESSWPCLKMMRLMMSNKSGWRYFFYFTDTHVQQRKTAKYYTYHASLIHFHAAYIIVTYVLLLPRWSKGILFPYFSYSLKSFLISKHACWEGRLWRGSYGSFCLPCICISFL